MARPGGTLPNSLMNQSVTGLSKDKINDSGDGSSDPHNTDAGSHDDEEKTFRLLSETNNKLTKQISH